MSQKEQVLEALKSGPLTQLKATNDLGVLRLSERIRELQKDGREIKHTPIFVDNRFGKMCRVMEYSLLVRKETDNGSCSCGSGCMIGTCPQCGREIGALR